MPPAPFGQFYRLRFVDFLIYQYGSLNRSALVEYFGISIPQASHDIKMYMEVAPNNMVYDAHYKMYRRTETFVRIWP